MILERPDFSFLSDMELIFLQKECRKLPDDKEYLHFVLEEIGNRRKEKKDGNRKKL